MMPNPIGSKLGVMNPPRLHANVSRNAASSRSAGTSETASTPLSRFDQNASRFGAPGNTAAIPTIAIGSGTQTPAIPTDELAGIRRREDHLRIATAAQLGEQGLDAALGIDQANAAPRELALEIAGHARAA